MDKIILATSSPYRKAAFEFLGLPFIAEGSNVEEYFEGRPDSPKELVQHLAKLKAEAVAKNHSQGIIIGFDSVVWFNGKIFEKPKSRQEAFDRLKSLSGNSHDFYTGIHIINLDNNKILSKVVRTEAHFRELSEYEINKYLKQDNEIWMNAAPGYDPLEHYSSSFVKGITGSYNNLTRGIPLEAIVQMLKEINYDFSFKITICGSSKFAKQMIEYKAKLEKLGFSVFVHKDYNKYFSDEFPELMQRVENEHAELKKENNYIQQYYNAIADSDAILVLNFDKNEIKNYIGANTFLEIGYAHCMHKKIFFLNPIPEQDYLTDELNAMDIIILNQDLSKIIY